MKTACVLVSVLTVSVLAATLVLSEEPAKSTVTYSLASIMRYFDDGNEKEVPAEDIAVKFDLTRTGEVDIDGYPLNFHWNYYDGLNDPVEFALEPLEADFSEEGLEKTIKDAFPSRPDTLAGEIADAKPLKQYVGGTDYTYSEKTTGEHEDSVIEQSKTVYDLSCILLVCEKGVYLIAAERHTTKRNKTGVFGLVKYKEKDEGVTYLVCKYTKVVA